MLLNKIKSQSQSYRKIPFSVAACSKAFLRREAILVPRHISWHSTDDVTPPEPLHGISTPSWAESPGDDAPDMPLIPAVETPPKVDWYMACMGIFPDTESWLPRADPEVTDGIPPSWWNDCPNPWRGNEGGRVNVGGAAPAFMGGGMCCAIGDVIDAIEGGQRPSLGWKLQRASLIVDGNCGSPWGGSSAPGVRKTFVAFLRFFHLARRFWNQTYG